MVVVRPGSVSPPLTPAQMRAIGQAMKYRLLADVLLAVSGIEVFGVQVFAGLASWAEELRQRADDAYSSAFNAQQSANYANVQLTLMNTGVLASDVPGGVSVAEQCNGGEANNFGGSWDRTSSGAGGGHFGPNGEGLGVWKKFGGLVRRHVDRHTTPLATDYQAVLVVMTTPPQAPVLGSKAYTYLCARMDSAGTTFVFARISNDEVAVGKCVAGTFTVWATQAVSTTPGDVWMFLVGTDDDDREVIVKQNGFVRIPYTDDAHDYGSSYLYVGMAAQSGDRLVFLDQTVPGEIDLWTAADRLATSV